MYFFNEGSLEMLKIAFEKSDVINFTRLVGHCTVKKKDVSLEVCTLVVGTYLYSTHTGYFDIFKTCFCKHLFLKNRNLDFLVQNQTFLKSDIAIL